MSNPALEPLKEQCRNLAQQKRYKEALDAAKQMQQIDAEDIVIHKLLALLYGLNEKHQEAHMHYMMLVQFDPSYTPEHCMLVAQSYAEKGMYKGAGLLAMAAANRLKDKKFAQFAAECFDQSGDAALAAKARSN